MNKDRFWYVQIIILYIPTKLLDKVTAKDILEYSNTLQHLNFEKMEDVYCYLKNEFKKINPSN